MNIAIISGNLSRDVETRTTQNGKTVANFTVAVNRRMPDANGNKVADFIPCVAFGKTAEFISKYFSKGKRIEVSGTIQTRNYDAQDGSKRYVTEILVDDAEFGEKLNSGNSNGNNALSASAAPTSTRSESSVPYTPAISDDYYTQRNRPMTMVEDNLDDDLPF